ncbi:MAG: molecular chaperone DnaK [Candidatus Campbellbacteria bacterium]|nr:molecular chaperone DnaK [Candidatus Campbellbacteria bacterium]
MSKILGIDLGTTNSAMAVIEGGEPTVIENAEGNRTTPSIVAISKNNERLVGLIAKRQAVTNPQNTIYGAKRFIGHSFDDKEVQKDKENMPFSIEKSDDGEGIKVKMGEKWHSPEEISAMVLQKMKKDAESKVGEEIKEAVITVPAYFDDNQRKATKDAGRIAGLEVKRILNEPTAAALAYGFNKKKDEKIVVYDFGGGTFDISVLEVGDDVVEVKSTDGDSHMGGRDIDQKIVRWLIDEFKKETGVDISKDSLALQRLDEAAEKAKHELSSQTETEINIPFITSTDEGPQHLIIKLNRSKLEELAEEFVERSIEITKRAIEASPFEFSDINEIILVGGQTRMPAIQKAVTELFGKEANKSINPDEVVALGAAVQAGILQGDVKDVLLLDVIPLSLGIETMGSVATKLIEKNTTIPASKSQTFSTAADNQTSVQIHVVQGERPMATDNKSLGQFILDGIPPAPRGVPQIEVTFDVDANGILNVKAVDKSSGKEQSIRIEATAGLSEEEIEKMREDAEKHAEEDEKRQKLIEAQNAADQLIYTSEKSLQDNKDTLSEDLKNSVQEKIDELKKAKESEDASEIESKTQALSTEIQKIGEQMAQQQQAQAGGASQGEAGGTEEQTGGSESEGETKDAEVKEDEDDTSSENKDEDQNKNS